MTVNGFSVYIQIVLALRVNLQQSWKTRLVFVHTAMLEWDAYYTHQRLSITVKHLLYFLLLLAHRTILAMTVNWTLHIWHMIVELYGNGEQPRPKRLLTQHARLKLRKSRSKSAKDALQSTRSQVGQPIQVQHVLLPTDLTFLRLLTILILTFVSVLPMVTRLPSNALVRLDSTCSTQLVNHTQFCSETRYHLEPNGVPKASIDETHQHCLHESQIPTEHSL